MGTAAPRTSGGTETEDSPPGPPPDDVGAWLGRGGCRSPARGSTRWARYRFGLGRSSSGGRRRAPTATGRLRPGPGGSDGWCITPEQVCWIASVCCCTAENCWAKPSTVSPNSPAWEIEKVCLVDVLDLYQVEPEMARERLSAYRPWTGDADGSSKWRRFMGTGAPRSLSPPGVTPGQAPSGSN